MDAPRVRKVKYVAGSGIMLQESLSDGQASFEAGIIYDILNYNDFLRLTQHGDFVEVKDEVVVPTPVATPEVTPEPAPITPVEDSKKKPAEKGDNSN